MHGFNLFHAIQVFECWIWLFVWVCHSTSTGDAGDAWPQNFLKMTLILTSLAVVRTGGDSCLFQDPVLVVPHIGVQSPYCHEKFHMMSYKKERWRGKENIFIKRWHYRLDNCFFMALRTLIEFSKYWYWGKFSWKKFKLCSSTNYKQYKKEYHIS